MKKRKILLCMALLLCLWGCTPRQGEKTEVVVFAAASLESALTRIAQDYQKSHEDVTLTFTFDSSGTLKTQLEQGAVCDLFLSAAQKQMNQLDAGDETGENTQGLDLVYTETRLDLLENRVVLAVPEENPARIHAFADLAEGEYLLCLGNEDVPVGAYSLEILDALGYSLEQLEGAGRITYASNVSEVARQVQEGVVDAGMVYATDASTYGLTVVDQATPDLCSPVVYPAAVMKSGQAPQAAQEFLTYLHTDPAAISVWQDVGFVLVE